MPSDEAAAGLDKLLARRTSVRQEAPAGPLSLDAIAGMLWLALRPRERPEFPPIERFHAYPSGGGLHSLCIHLAVGQGGVSGLDAGLYRYEPTAHHLVTYDRQGNLHELLALCSGAAGTASTGAAILVTSRIERVAASYPDVAQVLVLMETGALFQTLSLAGGVTGVGTCVLGPCIPQTLFSTMTGIDVRVQALVGEMRLCPPRVVR